MLACSESAREIGGVRSAPESSCDRWTTQSFTATEESRSISLADACFAADFLVAATCPHAQYNAHRRFQPNIDPGGSS